MPNTSERHLHDVLTFVLGDATAARELVRSALVSTAREALPTEAPALLAFIQAHVLERLTELAGPRLALAALDDLRVRLGSLDRRPTRRIPAMEAPAPSPLREPASRPQASEGMVLVADANAFVRAGVARLLVQAHRSVEVATELGDANRPLAGYAGIVVAVRREDGIRAFTRRVSDIPSTCIVVLVTDRATPELRALFRAGALWEILPETVPATVVVLRLLEGLNGRAVANGDGHR